jgi:hypothetical protein
MKNHSTNKREQNVVQDDSTDEENGDVWRAIQRGWMIELTVNQIPGWSLFA